MAILTNPYLSDGTTGRYDHQRDMYEYEMIKRREESLRLDERYRQSLAYSHEKDYRQPVKPAADPKPNKLLLLCGV